MGKKHKTGAMVRFLKPGALIVSLLLHAALISVALVLVAVSVVIKDEAIFESHEIKRPKMNLRKLQVPVNVSKSVRQPKLRKQIVVTPKLNNPMPDLKMPEIVGVKGGLGAGSGGFGSGGSLGFSMPEISMFGIKSKGERVFFVLDASDTMMVDEIGGVRAYEIIKSEMIRILRELNSSVLFNVVVYESYSAKKLFPGMVPASTGNVDKAVEWLRPLNRFTKDRTTQQQYGSHTTGGDGIGIDGSIRVEPLKGGVSHWATPVMEAMSEQADSIFILSSGWGFIAYKTGEAEGWGNSEEARFQKKLAEARQKLKEENDKRAAAGDPPRIIPAVNYDRNLVQAYFPGEPVPPYDQYVQYTPLDLAKAFMNKRKMLSDQSGMKTLGLPKKDKADDLKLNVIHFCRKGEGRNQDFMKITSLLHGEYRMIEGLEAVESYVHGGG